MDLLFRRCVEAIRRGESDMAARLAAHPSLDAAGRILATAGALLRHGDGTRAAQGLKAAFAATPGDVHQAARAAFLLGELLPEPQAATGLLAVLGEGDRLAVSCHLLEGLGNWEAAARLATALAAGGRRHWVDLAQDLRMRMLDGEPDDLALYFATLSPRALERAIARLRARAGEPAADFRLAIALEEERRFRGDEGRLDEIRALLRRAGDADPSLVFRQYGRPTTTVWDRLYALERNLALDGPAADSAYAAKPHPDPDGGAHVLQEYFLRAIGHFDALEVFVKQARLGLLGEGAKGLLLVRAPRHLANPAFLDLFRDQCADVLEIVTDPEEVARRYPETRRREGREIVSALTRPTPTTYYETSGWTMNVRAGEVFRRWDAAGMPPLLRPTREQAERGREILKGFGLGPDDWFVCLHVRESGFHAEVAGHQDYRNAAIGDYGQAIEEVVKRGGWVARVGDPSMRPLEPAERVIDLAVSDQRADWLDVFLWSACRFYIGTQSGPVTIVTATGTPRLMTNALLNTCVQHGRECDMVLPRLFRRRDGSLLPLGEMIGDHRPETWFDARVKAGELAPVPNQPDEIADAVAAMLDGPGAASPLQARFDAVARRSRVGPSVRLGPLFLEHHAALIDEG